MQSPARSAGTLPCCLAPGPTHSFRGFLSPRQDQFDASRAPSATAVFAPRVQRKCPLPSILWWEYDGRLIHTIVWAGSFFCLDEFNSDACQILPVLQPLEMRVATDTANQRHRRKHAKAPLIPLCGALREWNIDCSRTTDARCQGQRDAYRQTHGYGWVSNRLRIEGFPCLPRHLVWKYGRDE